MAGLQLICATASAFMVSRQVRMPSRAAAIAASTPACPAPTTTTSNRYSRALTLPPTQSRNEASVLKDTRGGRRVLVFLSGAGRGVRLTGTASRENEIPEWGGDSGIARG